jgi:hypothetical protein
MEKRLINYEDLSKSEKIDHIWEYYKFHIISVVVALFFIGWLLNHYIINPPPEITLDVSIFGDFADDSVVQELEDALNSLVIQEGENETAIVDFFSTDENLDYQMVQAVQTKMMGKATLNDFDIMIFQGDYFQMFLQEDVMAKLDPFVNSGVIKVDESLLLKGKDIDYVGDDIYFVDVSDSQGLQRILNSDEPLYLGIHYKSRHIEHVKLALDYIINEFE